MDKINYLLSFIPTTNVRCFFFQPEVQSHLTNPKMRLFGPGPPLLLIFHYKFKQITLKFSFFLRYLTPLSTRLNFRETGLFLTKKIMFLIC